MRRSSISILILAVSSLLAAGCQISGESVAITEEDSADVSVDDADDADDVVKETRDMDGCSVVVAPDEVDFGAVVIGEVVSYEVTVRNLCDEPVAMDIQLSGSSDFALLTSRILVSAREAATLEIAYAPEAEDTDLGTLTLQAYGESFAVDLLGNGRKDRCPVAVARARIRDFGPWEKTLSASAGAVIQLDGGDSYDTDGDDIVQYQWKVVEAPIGFSIGFAPNSRTIKPTIQTAVVGDYRFELQVTDSLGRQSCSPAAVEVRATTNRQLVVELVWQTPADPDESDTGMGVGTDLDLHMIRHDGFWEDKFGDSDVYFSNSQANWGQEGSQDDNAILTRDDTDGGGPEIIAIQDPAHTDGSEQSGYEGPYQIGVYFYDDWDFEAPVLAQVRVYFGENKLEPDIVIPAPAGPESSGKRFTNSDPSPAREGDFWLVGEIHWTEDGGSFVAVDEMLNGYPE